MKLHTGNQRVIVRYDKRCLSEAASLQGPERLDSEALSSTSYSRERGTLSPILNSVPSMTAEQRESRNKHLFSREDNWWTTQLTALSAEACPLHSQKK